MTDTADPITQQQEPADLDPTQQVVAVRIGSTEFGLPISLVREILHVPPITRLPFPPRSVAGVVAVRGEVLPVLDLGHRLFGRPSRRDGRIVVVTEPADGDLALLVDGVVDVVPLAGKPEQPPPEVEASLPAGWIAGVIAADGGRLVTLLHLEPVLARSDPADEESR
ncbi:MAG: chemotaxis protein CheW [Gemmatimonadota bacterium]